MLREILSWILAIAQVVTDVSFAIATILFVVILVKVIRKYYR